MTINEFVEKYNLHDSLLESIVYDKNNKKATICVDFCYWQQEDYEESLSETGMILIELDEVISLNYKPFTINSDEIVEVSSEGDEITLSVFNDIKNDNIDIVIKAKNVTVSEWQE